MRYHAGQIPDSKTVDPTSCQVNSLNIKVNPNIRKRLIKSYPSDPILGPLYEKSQNIKPNRSTHYRHWSFKKAYDNLRRNFYWPLMVRDKVYIASCEHCQQNKSSLQHPSGS
ncbi:hypothetical protein BGZ65_005037, partial [Modicella reniformis]